MCVSQRPIVLCHIVSLSDTTRHVSVMTSHVFKGTDNVICKCGNTLTNTAGSQMKDCDDACPADANQWCGGSEGQQLILSVDGTYVRALVGTYREQAVNFCYPYTCIQQMPRDSVTALQLHVDYFDRCIMYTV